MSALMTHAAWALLAAFALSFGYELYRATVRAGTSKYDSMRKFPLSVVFYGAAGVIVAGLFAGAGWASWAGLIYSGSFILVSIFYYNPVLMAVREPNIIDWFEDLVFTGLLFVAATLLSYEVLGKTLV